MLVCGGKSGEVPKEASQYFHSERIAREKEMVYVSLGALISQHGQANKNHLRRDVAYRSGCHANGISLSI